MPDELDPPKTLKAWNPNLCSSCQTWNDIWTCELGPGHAITHPLSLLSANTHCLICRVVARAVRLRQARSVPLAQRSESEIIVRNLGPYFFDRGRFPNSDYGRMDCTDPSATIVHVLIALEIVARDGHEKVEDQETTTEMTPQFYLRYCTGDAPSLVSVEPLEVPFFDLSLIRAWLHGCDSFHGLACATSNAPGKVLPPLYPQIPPLLTTKQTKCH